MHSNHSTVFRFLILALTSAAVAPRASSAAEIKVPHDRPTLRAALETAVAGDQVLVSPGVYRERIRLKAGVVMRSAGGNDVNAAGALVRAAATVIDGGGEAGEGPGVAMAESSVLDGFTVTNVGVYDEKVWKQHFDSHGEDLGDDEGALQAEGSSPAIQIEGVTCSVLHCIVHHNGDVGVGILGKAGAKTTPLVADNQVYRNMGGGIGAAEGAEPIIRGNQCSENLRAGIGCRQANPLIIDNACFRNVRAGIGCREGSRPMIRGNKCYLNRRAGIGIRMPGTAPIVAANECYENEMAGIGCRDGASPLLRGNVCRDNKLVAIGVTEGSNAVIVDNELSRVGGVPPLIAVKDQSTAVIADNRISGGGVAAVLIQGQATIRGNTFTSRQPKQGPAVWVWSQSTAIIADNKVDGYSAAVKPDPQAKVIESK